MRVYRGGRCADLGAAVTSTATTRSQRGHYSITAQRRTGSGAGGPAPVWDQPGHDRRNEISTRPHDNDGDTDGAFARQRALGIRGRRVDVGRAITQDGRPHPGRGQPLSRRRHRAGLTGTAAKAARGAGDNSRASPQRSISGMRPSAPSRCGADGSTAWTSRRGLRGLTLKTRSCQRHRFIQRPVDVPTRARLRRAARGAHRAASRARLVCRPAARPAAPPNPTKTRTRPDEQETTGYTPPWRAPPLWAVPARHPGPTSGGARAADRGSVGAGHLRRSLIRRQAWAGTEAPA